MNYLFKHLLLLIVLLELVSCEDNSQNKHKAASDKIENDTIIVTSPYKMASREEIQTFEINPNKLQEIKGEKGTEITFPDGCFGKVDGMIHIELIECYSIQDLFYNGLSTQTIKGELLESDGMIWLNALSKTGDTLVISQGKVKVQMVTDEVKDGMKIFDGVRVNENIQWDLSEVRIQKVKTPQETTGSNTVDNEKLVDIAIDTFDSNTYNPYSNNPEKIIDKTIKDENLINYVFQISNMGWINCDRYIEKQTAPLVIKVSKENLNASYYLVLNNYNSSVPPKKESDEELSFMVPVNEPFTIVAIATRGEAIYFRMVDYQGGQREITFPELVPVSRQQLTDELLKKFGKDIWNRPLV